MYVYTHWNGHKLWEDAIKAVQAAQSRWFDDTYCLRILVDQMTKASRDEENGSGLSLFHEFEDSYNADRPSVVIDIPNQTVEGFGGHKAGPLSFHQTLVLSNRNP